MNEFKNIKRALLQKQNASRAEFSKLLKSGPLGEYSQYSGVSIVVTNKSGESVKQYTAIKLTDRQREKTEKEQKEIILQKWDKEHQKETEKDFARLDEIANTAPAQVVNIYVDWVKSNTWGFNPNASIFWSSSETCGRAEGRASGCGYDKETAAVGEALNACPAILAPLYIAFDKALQRNKGATLNNVLGYGSGYGLKPYFEGGVGIGCFDKIFEKLGYIWTHTGSGKHFDSYTARYSPELIKLDKKIALLTKRAEVCEKSGTCGPRCNYEKKYKDCTIYAEIYALESKRRKMH